MDPDWACENLRVIRTLMERSALYRRALAPVTLLVGVVGLAASWAGWRAGFTEPRSFLSFWLLVSAGCAVGALLLVRRQALKASEPVWSPPTRRVVRAALPALTVGLFVALLSWKRADPDWVQWMPPLWMTLYGCALHAAGFFMQRGIKWVGWLFVAAGCVSGAWMATAVDPPAVSAYWMMGGAFGGLHLAYGAYLSLTESKSPAA